MKFFLNIKDEKVKSFISILWVVSYVLPLICKIINLKEIKLDKYMKKSIFQIILLVILLLCYLIESVSYFQNRKNFFSKLRSHKIWWEKKILIKYIKSKKKEN